MGALLEPERRKILFGTVDGIWRVNVAVGSPERITIDDQGAKGLHVYPRWLPDGRHFVYLARDVDANNRGIYLGAVDGGRSVRLVPDESAPIFVEGINGTGHLLFVRGASLVSQVLDIVNRRVEGEPSILADRIMIGQTVRRGAYDASPTLLVHRSGGGVDQTELALLDRAGRRLSTLEGDGYLTHIALAPDDLTIALQRSNISTNTYELWQFDLLRGGTRPMLVRPYSIATPVWSADSKRLAFLSHQQASGAHSSSRPVQSQLSCKGPRWASSRTGLPTDGGC